MSKDLGTYKGKPVTEEMAERWSRRFEVGIDPTKLRPSQGFPVATCLARSPLLEDDYRHRCQSSKHGPEYPHYCWADDHSWVLIWAWEGETL